MPEQPIYRFARHARNRMRRWHLAEEDVITVLRGADVVTPSIRGRSNAWRWTPAGWLRVTYIQEERWTPQGRAIATIIITVTRRERGPQEGDSDEDDL